ncbi:MAG: HAD-IA family hydrolase [Candidatus Binatus sp.]|uniref:HAD-IA family hydrolase n=1 Tax=Candidatus Binatus sp. TaxID=2811406 RepID=UPI0027185BFE|nr:HAD-IA family hydrolase [Candidatus Binatus sp.]MDO8434622.1 HAD-IA family hydrolase [Candidatus Binatus sp.]
MIRAAYFDAAGTLFDSREPIGRSYARIARQFGVDASEDAVAARFREAFHASEGLAFGQGHRADEIRRLEREWWRARVVATFEPFGRFRDFDAYFAALFEYFADPAHWRVFPEASETLLRLKNRGFKLGVISNFDHRLYRILDGLDLARYFDSISISSEVGYAKPRREIFEAALGRLGVAAGDAMHIGDSERLDYAAAEAAGIAAVLVDRGRGNRAPQIEARRAKIASLAQVIEVTQVFGSA